MLRTGIAFAKEILIAVDDLYDELTAAQFQRGFYRVGNTNPIQCRSTIGGLTNDETINNCLNGVWLVFFETNRFIEIVDSPVDTGAHKTTTANLAQYALALAGKRCQ